MLAVTPSWTGVFFFYGGALKMIGSNDLASVTLAGASSIFAPALLLVD